MSCRGQTVMLHTSFAVSTSLMRFHEALYPHEQSSAIAYTRVCMCTMVRTKAHPHGLVNLQELWFTWSEEGSCGL
jgi:hypothetical protein